MKCIDQRPFVTFVGSITGALGIAGGFVTVAAAFAPFAARFAFDTDAVRPFAVAGLIGPTASTERSTAEIWMSPLNTAFSSTGITCSLGIRLTTPVYVGPNFNESAVRLTISSKFVSTG